MQPRSLSLRRRSRCSMHACMHAGYPVLRRGLTPVGVAHAWLLGASVFSAFGAAGYLLVCLYFIFGTLVTKASVREASVRVASVRS